jgi:hypothetical protein
MKNLVKILIVVGAAVYLIILMTLFLQGNVAGMTAMRAALLAPLFLAVWFTLYRAKPIK